MITRRIPEYGMKTLSTCFAPLILIISFLGCDIRLDLLEKAKIKISDLTVEYQSPVDKSSDIPVNAKICVKFSSQMNKESVHDSFHIICYNHELDQYDGTFEWFNNDHVFLFTPLSLLPRNTRITVKLANEARDVNDYYLLDGFEWSFTTTEAEDTIPLEATLLSPDTDNDTAVDIYPKIEIEFSKEIIVCTSCATFRLTSDDAADIRTSDDGTFTCNGIILTFIPHEPLIYNTWYSIDFNNGNEVYVQDLSGNLLITPFDSFHTPENIIFVSPYGNDADTGFKTNPKRSVTSAIERAAELGFPYIMIANGEYIEDINMINDILLMGGYQTDWITRDFNTNIYPVSSNYTLQFLNVSGPAIDGLNIYGNNNSTNETSAVLINNSNNIVIENCNIYGSTDGETTGGILGDVYGIYIENANNITVKDNIINGGITSGGSTHGIKITNSAKVDIYRNTIIGGKGIDGAETNIGIMYEHTWVPEEYYNLFNNFIVGGTQDTNPSDLCYGVYIKNTNVNIVNNTIDGGGNLSSPEYTYGIFCTDDSGGWQINPIIINNYILGGNGDPSYGIFLDNTGKQLDCVIYNNIFNRSSCTDYAGSGEGSVSTISGLNESFGALLFNPSPTSNYEDINHPDATFTLWEESDYHITTSSPSCSLVKDNKGHDGDYNYLYGEENILIDIDGQQRIVGDLDLGADEIN